MTKASHTIHVDPTSELARALKEADAAPVVLESNGVHFRVIRASDEIWAGYDP
jgi:hypothetical protein